MNSLSLINSNNTVIASQDNSMVIKELMQAIRDIGCVPNVFYDSKTDSTRLEFEGMYCNVNLYLKVE